MSAQELVLLRHLLEARLFGVGHVFLAQASRVRDVLLLADVDVLHQAPKLVVVGLDQATDRVDVELVWVGVASEIGWQSYLLTGAL